MNDFLRKGKDLFQIHTVRQETGEHLPDFESSVWDDIPVIAQVELFIEFQHNGDQTAGGGSVQDGPRDEGAGRLLQRGSQKNSS